MCSCFLLLIWLSTAQSSRGPNFTIRYAILEPYRSAAYLHEVGLPMLKSSVCLAEKHLTPDVNATFSVLPDYIIYTDNGTHYLASSLVQAYFPDLKDRVRFLNLDLDPADSLRWSEFYNIGLDSVNLASLRRTLADTDHLPVGSRRLLLGLDISLLARQNRLVNRIFNAGESEALYMVDHNTFGTRGLLYGVRNYPGPQCPGFMADFVYLAPDLHISIESLKSKIYWYAGQPHTPDRTDPPVTWLAFPNASGGLHGIEQFALNLAVAEAAFVQSGRGGCHWLNLDRYMNLGQAPRPSLDAMDVDVIHDKVISSCGTSRFDQCGPVEHSRRLASPEWQRAPMLTLEISGVHQASEVLQLESTLKAIEAQLAPKVHDYLESLPVFAIYTNDHTCGPVSSLLFREFASVAARVILINADLETESSGLQQLSADLGVGAFLFATSRRAFATSGVVQPRGGWPFIGVEVVVLAKQGRSAMLPLQEIVLHGNTYLYMCEYVHYYGTSHGATAPVGADMGSRFFVYDHAFIFSTLTAGC